MQQHNTRSQSQTSFGKTDLEGEQIDQATRGQNQERVRYPNNNHSVNPPQIMGGIAVSGPAPQSARSQSTEHLASQGSAIESSNADNRQGKEATGPPANQSKILTRRTNGITIQHPERFRDTKPNFKSEIAQSCSSEQLVSGQKTFKKPRGRPSKHEKSKQTQEIMFQNILGKRKGRPHKNNEDSLLQLGQVTDINDSIQMESYPTNSNNCFEPSKFENRQDMLRQATQPNSQLMNTNQQMSRVVQSTTSQQKLAAQLDNQLSERLSSEQQVQMVVRDVKRQLTYGDAGNISMDTDTNNKHEQNLIQEHFHNNNAKGIIISSDNNTPLIDEQDDADQDNEMSDSSYDREDDQNENGDYQQIKDESQITMTEPEQDEDCDEEQQGLMDEQVMAMHKLELTLKNQYNENKSALQDKLAKLNLTNESIIQRQRDHPHLYKVGPTKYQDGSTKGHWTQEEDLLLTDAVAKNNQRNWKKIAEELDGRTDVQCLHRWQKVLNPCLVKGPWTEEEDRKVLTLVWQKGAQKWTQIAENLDGRIGKQCRERWHNHLNPMIKKNPWTKEEEWVLYLCHREKGNLWAEIAQCLEGRTDNTIKNHWNSSMRKKFQDFKREFEIIIKKACVEQKIEFCGIATEDSRLPAQYKQFLKKRETKLLQKHQEDIKIQNQRYYENRALEFLEKKDQDEVNWASACMLLESLKKDMSDFDTSPPIKKPVLAKPVTFIGRNSPSATTAPRTKMLPDTNQTPVEGCGNNGEYESDDHENFETPFPFEIEPIKTTEPSNTTNTQNKQPQQVLQALQNNHEHDQQVNKTTADQQFVTPFNLEPSKNNNDCSNTTTIQEQQFRSANLNNPETLSKKQRLSCNKPHSCSSRNSSKKQKEQKENLKPSKPHLKIAAPMQQNPRQHQQQQQPETPIFANLPETKRNNLVNLTGEGLQMTHQTTQIIENIVVQEEQQLNNQRPVQTAFLTNQTPQHNNQTTANSSNHHQQTEDGWKIGNFYDYDDYNVLIEEVPSANSMLSNHILQQNNDYHRTQQINQQQQHFYQNANNAAPHHGYNQTPLNTNHAMLFETPSTGKIDSNNEGAFFPETDSSKKLWNAVKYVYQSTFGGQNTSNLANQMIQYNNQQQTNNQSFSNSNNDQQLLNGTYQHFTTSRWIHAGNKLSTNNNSLRAEQTNKTGPSAPAHLIPSYSAAPSSSIHNSSSSQKNTIILQTNNNNPNQITTNAYDKQIKAVKPFKIPTNTSNEAASPDQFNLLRKQGTPLNSGIIRHQHSPLNSVSHINPVVQQSNGQSSNLKSVIVYPHQGHQNQTMGILTEGPPPSQFNQSINQNGAKKATVQQVSQRGVSAFKSYGYQLNNNSGSQQAGATSRSISHLEQSQNKMQNAGNVLLTNPHTPSPPKTQGNHNGAINGASAVDHRHQSVCRFSLPLSATQQSHKN